MFSKINYTAQGNNRTKDGMIYSKFHSMFNSQHPEATKLDGTENPLDASQVHELMICMKYAMYGIICMK